MRDWSSRSEWLGADINRSMQPTGPKASPISSLHRQLYVRHAGAFAGQASSSPADAPQSPCRRCKWPFVSRPEHVRENRPSLPRSHHVPHRSPGAELRLRRVGPALRGWPRRRTLPQSDRPRMLPQPACPRPGLSLLRPACRSTGVALPQGHAVRGGPQASPPARHSRFRRRYLLWLGPQALVIQGGRPGLSILEIKLIKSKRFTEDAEAVSLQYKIL